MISFLAPTGKSKNKTACRTIAHDILILARIYTLPLHRSKHWQRNVRAFIRKLWCLAVLHTTCWQCCLCFQCSLPCFLQSLCPCFPWKSHKKCGLACEHKTGREKKGVRIKPCTTNTTQPGAKMGAQNAGTLLVRQETAKVAKIPNFRNLEAGKRKNWAHNNNARAMLRSALWPAPYPLRLSGRLYKRKFQLLQLSSTHAFLSPTQVF